LIDDADLVRLERLSRRPRRLLALFPHPDDESYGCAGALARLAADPDAAAACCCLTRGEAARFGVERGLAPEETAALRTRRMQDVAQVLGLDALVLGSFPDGKLARAGWGELAAGVGAVLDVYRPHVVIAHDPRGVNAHPDHIASHWALRHALTDRPAPRLAMVCYPPEIAEAAKPRLLFPTAREEMDAILELTPDESSKKERCLRIHEALVTLEEHGDASLVLRPAVECYDFLGERCAPPLRDLFAGIA
jgi:LmbE family N-acetylglucosaminyl deacetylase